MEAKDIRWIQRFENYRHALAKLAQAIEIVNKMEELKDIIVVSIETDDLLKEGLIQRFEYTHELAWKVMKDYAEYQGYNSIRGSRDAFRQALQMGIINDKQWLESVDDRNLTSHNYDKEIAEDIYSAIINIYYPLFLAFEQTMLSEIEPNHFQSCHTD